MTELMSLHGWAYPAMRFGSSDGPKKKASRSPDGRSPTPGRSPSPNKTVLRAKSSNALTEMAGGTGGGTGGPSFRRSPSIYEENSLNTLKDPRVASTSDLSSSTPAGAPDNNLSPHHPDLNSEVAALSDKLIQAINNQTMLDASLSSTRQELDASRAKVAHLEQKCKEHEDELSSGRLTKTHDIEIERSLMRDALEDEKARRVTAEKEKKGIEQELENLTAALFEEANKMVAGAKKEREAAERKNDQLRAQVKDTELLVASHQEQLAELKSTMQQMHGDRDDATDSKTNPSTTPVSPAFTNTNNNRHDSIGRRLGAVDLSPTTPGSGNISPAPSTSFGHLIKSVCRRDIPAYDDFHALLHLAAPRSNPHSRTGSASSHGGRSVMSFSNFTANNRSSQNLTTSNGGTASTTPSGTTSQTPTPNPNGLTASPRDPPSQLSVPLKETRFYKRVLTEDIEPALRLDTAPSISWLTRRSVLSSICEGSLVIEPLPSVTIRYAFPCALCGERRNGSENPRLHRFRTSDSDSAQRYTLCMVCLEKMRACCDFVSFLRLIVDGHVRAADEEDEREAWEETVRLRERLFWARIGGGVVPTFVQKKDSERDENSSVLGCDSPQPRNDRESTTTQDAEQRVEVPDANAATADDKATDPFVSKAERVSIGNTVISISGMETGSSGDAAKSQHQEDENEESKLHQVDKDEEKKDADDADKTTTNTESHHLVERHEETKETNAYADKHTACPDSSHLTGGDADNTHGSISRPSTSSTSSVTASKGAKGAEQGLKAAIPASFEF